jgi:glycosyltransferase involved in cell wall biosynthesis
MKVRVIANIPNSIAYGGFERRAIRTALELKKIGVDARMLDWHDSNDNFDILILFGLNSQWIRIVENIGEDKKIVIMHINSNQNYKLLALIKIKIREKIAKLFRIKSENNNCEQITQRADLIICVNEVEKLNLIKLYGKNIVKKIVMQNNGVDDRLFEISEESNKIKNEEKEKYVLFVGSICKRKNPLLLARELEKFKINGLFIGDSLKEEKEYKTEFETFINNSVYQKWKKNENWENDKLLKIYKNASLMCLISESETQPQVILEALSIGLPCLILDTDYTQSFPFTKLEKIKIENLNNLGNKIQEMLRNDKGNKIYLPENYRWSNVANSLKNNLLKIYEKNN